MRLQVEVQMLREEVISRKQKTNEAMIITTGNRCEVSADYRCGFSGGPMQVSSRGLTSIFWCRLTRVIVPGVSHLP